MREQARWVQLPEGPVLPFTPLNAVIAVPIFLIMVMPRWSTFIFLIGVAIFMVILQMKGISFSCFIRYLKGRMRGGRVAARPVWYRRRFQHLHPVTALRRYEGQEVLTRKRNLYLGHW